MRIHTKFGDVLHLHIKIRTITVDFTLIIHKTLGKGAKKKIIVSRSWGNAKSFFGFLHLDKEGQDTNWIEKKEEGRWRWK